MKRILIFLGCILCSSGVLHAQNSTLDPTDLFESGVKSVAIEPIINAVVPSVKWDDDRREVTVLSDDQPKKFPYPDEVYSFSEQFNPIWRDQVVLSGYTETGEVGFWPFILNVQTGTFVRYHPQCGANSPTDLDRNLLGDLWVLETTPNGIDLCATLTGERTPALDLPKDFVPTPPPRCMFTTSRRAKARPCCALSIKPNIRSASPAATRPTPPS
ncbi:MAG: hypothetical protein ABI690_08820 [Chloroflexota bacterium]